MTIFLRNDKNRSVVDIEVNSGKSNMDIHSIVVIDAYSKVLLANLNRSDEVVEDFQSISELRGWFWEVYMESVEAPNFNEVIIKIRDMLIPIAEKYNLNYIVD